MATVESIGYSTGIEDNKLSNREVERLLSNLAIESFASRDEQEVAGYAEVMETVFRVWEALPFTENYIKQLHRGFACVTVGKTRGIAANTRSCRQRRGHR